MRTSPKPAPASSCAPAQARMTSPCSESPPPLSPWRRLRRGLLTAIGLMACGLSLATAAPASTTDAPELMVLAASSLTDALNEVGTAYTRDTRQRVKLSFAASSALARQIEAGAPADAFVSADTAWMDYLQVRKLITPETRADVVGNQLVLIAPADSTVQLEIGPRFPLAAALGNGRLATGDPDSVPVGRYAKAALTRFHVWDQIKDRIAATDNVRSALAFVARGEAPLGIVYRTDALLEKQVRVVALFPAGSYGPVTCPAAVTTQARAGADRFVRYLKSPTAQAIFHKYGFDPPPPTSSSPLPK